MPPKSIFRQPGARHFQLVHRSQRDPLIHDSEASQHVLKEFQRENPKGKTRADLESTIPAIQLAHDLERANIGEAAAYGVYYDDTNYDYMQHLKPVVENGLDSILIEAPAQKPKSKGSKSRDPIHLIDLPPEALPSTSELPMNYETQEAVPSSISGFRPDMDQHLRQTLEALDDDAFVDDDLEDDFFGELVAEGERDPNENIDFEFHEWGNDVERAEEETNKIEDMGGWEAAFNKFRKTESNSEGNSDLDFDSEGGDTLGSIPRLSVIGGKKRRKGSSVASGYSMSSSSMFRNEGLTLLDDQFNQVEKEYASDEDSETHSESDDVPELLTSRDDFAAMMNQFMEEYEIVGGKMKLALAGDSAIEKLETLRSAFGQTLIRDREFDDGDSDENDDRDILVPLGDNDVKDRWDCETILTTYSNLENHPRLISARDTKSVPKIRLDPKTGLPSSETTKSRTSQRLESVQKTERDSPIRETVARARGESKEDKKTRKQAVKAERQARRGEKKMTKERFSAEMHSQAKSLANKERMLRVKTL